MIVPSVLLFTEKKVLRYAQYLKLPIDAHQVYTIFECHFVCLISPAKEIFQKFPKMVIFEFILNLPQVFYLVEATQITKNCFLRQL